MLSCRRKYRSMLNFVYIYSSVCYLLFIWSKLPDNKTDADNDNDDDTIMCEKPAEAEVSLVT